MSAAAKTGAAAPSPVLPPLRQDLELIEAAPDISGARRWLIYDPVQHKFTAIGQGVHALLQVWQDGLSIDVAIETAWERFSETLRPVDIAQFIGFMQANRLTLEAPGGGWRSLAAVAAKHRSSWASHLLHTYLFFRVPLARPERFLAATIGKLSWLGTRRFAVAIGLIGTTGLYLVSREWDAFRATFAGIATLEGAALLGLALMVVKLIHELGHAYVATAHRCRVPVLGVAFILGTPLLYCDVTDAWRLKSRKARLQVDMAGILADVSVACVATFLWAFLPPGVIKHFLFSLATAGWVLSLTMNLNPFMKFDGYHIASDIIGIENMQDRAMTLGRWRLREILFALRVPPPEQLPSRVMILLTLYAWSLWIYRLVVFTGIALVVYHFFFKLAGLLLFAVEIGYFIVAPIVREFREWWKMRSKIVTSGRAPISAGLLLAFVALLITPISSQVRIPAVLETYEIARLYPSQSAKVAQVHISYGDKVERGALLVSLDRSDLEQELELNRLKSMVVELRLDRAVSDTTDREETAVLAHERAALKERSDGLLRQIKELEMTAPFSGQIVELMPALHVGRSLNARESVLVVRGGAVGEIRGALDEGDLWRLKPGAKSTFIPDDATLPSVKVSVAAISKAAMATLDQVELAGSHGGRVADRLDARKQPVPVNAQYAVRGVAVDELPDAYLTRSAAGILMAEGSPESLLSRSWRQVLKVLVRESGL